ncbi:DUF2164 domain-containing protein [Leptospira wolffii]|uniref:DUF2164 domain-containing protein n=1 Tax=Leptospira wolffii TaxID=409998 RepID=A0ABV5BRS5_9LEPT|nr:DUF2164 domain-containing protein [Leptospira wolffii]EPG66140.1 PF09932 family protein [Leptospira wolffii serovar Khorat str. Khorat-H2]TGL50489.1 DUF2164 domain-containing protein [Leptospira wolffii]
MAIELSKEESKSIIHSIQKYFEKELDMEIGEMQSGFLLKYFLTEIGPFVYNKAIKDAEDYLIERANDLSAIYHQEELTYWVKNKGK